MMIILAVLVFQRSLFLWMETTRFYTLLQSHVLQCCPKSGKMQSVGQEGHLPCVHVKHVTYAVCASVTCWITTAHWPYKRWISSHLWDKTFLCWIIKCSPACSLTYKLLTGMAERMRAHRGSISPRGLFVFPAFASVTPWPQSVCCLVFPPLSHLSRSISSLHSSLVSRLQHINYSVRARSWTRAVMTFLLFTEARKRLLSVSEENEGLGSVCTQTDPNLEGGAVKYWVWCNMLTLCKWKMDILTFLEWQFWELSHSKKPFHPDSRGRAEEGRMQTNEASLRWNDFRFNCAPIPIRPDPEMPQVNINSRSY